MKHFDYGTYRNIKRAMIEAEKEYNEILVYLYSNRVALQFLEESYKESVKKNTQHDKGKDYFHNPDENRSLEFTVTMMRLKIPRLERDLEIKQKKFNRLANKFNKRTAIKDLINKRRNKSGRTRKVKK